MPEISYIFGDVLTGNIIEEIRLTSVSVKDTLNGSEFRAVFYLDQTGKSNDQLLSATVPGRSFCVVERDGVIIGDYYIWTRTYQSQAKVFQLYGVGFKDYPELRFIIEDYIAFEVEQRNIFRDLYIMMQAAEGSIRIDLPEPFPTEVVKSIAVLGSEYKTYRQVLDSISDGENGFDWLIRTWRENNRYKRRLDIGFPQIGALPGDSTPVFEYVSPSADHISGGGNIINYWSNDSMANAGTHFYGIGSGEGSSMLVSVVGFDDMITNGFPRIDRSLDRKDIATQTTLNQVTYQHAILYKAPTSTITAEIKADGDPEFGGFGLGDACRLDILDPRYPNGFSRQTRILGWEYYPPENDNIEMIRLVLEGEES